MNAHRLLPAALLVTVSLLLSACSTPLVRDANTAPQENQQLMVTEVQTMLSTKGFDPGPADGIAGARTMAALAEYQRARGLPITKGVTKEAHLQLATDQGGQSDGARDSTRSPNDSHVTFEVPCPDVEVPEIFTKKIRGAVPVHTMRVVNSGENEYSVKYALSYKDRPRTLAEDFGGRFSLTQRFAIGPRESTEIALLEVNQGAGSLITSIEEVTVLECRTD